MKDEDFADMVDLIHQNIPWDYAGERIHAVDIAQELVRAGFVKRAGK
jgi:hypothetical protein